MTEHSLEGAGSTATGRAGGLDGTAVRLAARGDFSLARARSVPVEAVEAARALARIAERSGRPDLAIVILRGLVALDPRDAAAARALRAPRLRAWSHRAPLRSRLHDEPDGW